CNHPELPDSPYSRFASRLLIIRLAEWPSSPGSRNKGMFPNLSSRWIPSILLILLWGLLCLPNLGAPTLWEIDEGRNSQAAQEMYESGNWIVPSFNSEVRNAKPVMLYWLQAGCYALLGVNETSARLPSALAGLFSILTVHWLGRRLFNPTVGLL